ncbi:MAG: conjugal transfer protein TraF [Reinekea sp.]
MIRSSLALTIALISSVSWADNIHYLNSGTAVTVGPISNAQLGSSGRFNPATISLNTDHTRLTLIDFAANIQLQGLGEFDTVFNNMSDQIDSISTTFDDFSNGDASVGDVLAGVNDLETSFDSNVQLLADSFYIKPGIVAGLPLMPLNFKLGQVGTFSVGASSLTQARASLLHGPITFDIDAQTISDTNNAGNDLDPIDYLRTTSSLYLKQAQIFNVDLSYARPLPAINFLDRNDISATGGVRATVIGYNLQKTLYPIKEVARQAVDDSGTLTDNLKDDVMAGFESFNFNVTLDLGVTLQRNDTLVGITLYNLNSPEITYNTLGGDCASVTDSDAQNECFHAEYFASVGDITLEESHHLAPRLTLDVSQSFFDNRLAVAAAGDLWRKNDLFGDQSQNLNVAFLAQPKAWYWPRLRLGIGKDLVDLDPTQLGLGLSLFNFLQIDAQMNTVLGDLFSTDQIKQGNALRAYSVSASVNLAF